MKLALYSEIILASTSPSRRALMDEIGLKFRVVAPQVSEDYAEGTPPAHAVAMLSERKARVVASEFPTALVIGSDQLVSLDGRALGKPESERVAKEQLRRLCGRTHEICTGVCVIGPGFLETEVDVGRLTVGDLSEAEVDAYVALGEWRGCAGGYRIEGRGQLLFSKIEADRSAIRGLPMQQLIQMLRDAQVSLFQ